MINVRSVFGFWLLSTACISRGGDSPPPPPPTTDIGTDAAVPDDSVTPTDRMQTGDGARPMCSPTMAAENTVARCADGLDNDCDGFADCNDFDCKKCSIPACVVNNTVSINSDGGTCMCMGTVENSATACADGIDNDCNGFTDCQDFGCQNCAVPLCLADGGVPTRDGGFCVCRGPENTTAACSDGVDNDCNSFIDCNDFSCTRADAGTVTSCDAAVVSDAGGRADVAGCVRMGSENTNAACSDGIDNDCDGFIDCGRGTLPDFNCTQTAAVTVCGGTDAGTRD
jgi:hypothetical protein